MLNIVNTLFIYHPFFLFPTTLTGLLRVDSVNLVLPWKVGDIKGRSVLHNKGLEPGMWDRAWLYLLEKAWVS